MANDIALIIIDMQVGAFDGSLVPPVSKSEKLLSNVIQLIKKARKAAIPIMFVQHQGEKNHPFEHGTNGCQIHPSLGITNEDYLVQKYTPDSFYNTGLHETLKSGNIKRLVIAGIQTEFCIDTTCRRAFSLDYEVTLVTNAHGTWDTDQLNASQIIEHHNCVLGDWFVTLKKASEINFS